VKFNVDERVAGAFCRRKAPYRCVISTDQAAIIALFRVVKPVHWPLPPMPGVFPDYPHR
jgi:hypothetical protein